MALAAEADPDAHAHINELMAALDSNLQLRLRRRVRALWEAARGVGSAAAARGAPPPPQSPGSGAAPTPAGRRPRPNFLPLDPASVAAGFRRKQSQLRRQAGAERAAPLKASLYSPSELEVPLSTDMSTPSTMDVECACAPPHLQHLPCSTDSVEEIIVYPHNQDMEGDTLVTYTEEVDWRRGPLLGTGAFSSCYQACDLQSGHLMAVKQVHVSTGCGSDTPSERAQREAALRAEVRPAGRPAAPARAASAGRHPAAGRDEPVHRVGGRRLGGQPAAALRPHER
ncbi:uncharacterized protein LOC119092627 [Pollicipes pollicipes]|uniref:uncharacterized protein LOC119092627 n=1 Tax=Pollicipes pollicipes TaxID=41117 RepID=UPI0018855A91|nr:uncharacterized protein LOC119092627 [Pollicipes pollicipes]